MDGNSRLPNIFIEQRITCRSYGAPFVEFVYSSDMPPLRGWGKGSFSEAAGDLCKTAIKNLEASGYSFQHNYPFKGGYITRHYGRPAENQHALQLEMSKVRHVLKHTLGEMIDRL